MQIIYTHNRSSRRKAKKPTKKMQAALREHEKYLYALGVIGACRSPKSCGEGASPSGRAKNKMGDKSKSATLGSEPRKPGAVPGSPSISFVATPCLKRDIFDVARNESPETRKEIMRKAARTAPAYNKGGYQYIGDGADLTTLGKKV